MILAGIRRNWLVRDVFAYRVQRMGAIFGLSIILVAGFFHIIVTHIDSDARFLMVWTPLWIVGLEGIAGVS